MAYIDEDNLMIITTSPIVGTVVKTPHHETVGEITGVILNTFTGDVPFALLSLNNNKGIKKDKHFAISWKDFESNTSDTQEFILDLNKIKWKNLLYFNSDYLSVYSQYELLDTEHTPQG